MLGAFGTDLMRMVILRGEALARRILQFFIGLRTWHGLHLVAT